MLHLFLWMKRMKNLNSIPILHDGVLQAQSPEILLRRIAEMSLTLHIHRLHSQPGCNIREIYSKATSQIYKPDFFRKIRFADFFFRFVNILVWFC